MPINNLGNSRAALETAERDAEARIVAWLRMSANAVLVTDDRMAGIQYALDEAADSIERGDHRKDGE